MANETMETILVHLDYLRKSIDAMSAKVERLTEDGLAHAETDHRVGMLSERIHALEQQCTLFKASQPPAPLSDWRVWVAVVALLLGGGNAAKDVVVSLSDKAPAEAAK